jgi:hypothetical protein
MGCPASAAAQRQRGGASEPRRTRHPWEGFCRESCGFPREPQETAANNLENAIAGFSRESSRFSREPLA